MKAHKFRFTSLTVVLGVFLFMAVMLFLERLGIQVQDKQKSSPYLPREKVLTSMQAMNGMEKTCLVLTDLGREDCLEPYDEYQQIFLDLRIPAEFIDLGSQTIPESLDSFQTLVVLTPDVSAFSARLTDIFNWVKQGGRILLGMPLENNVYANFVYSKAGVVYSSDYIITDSIYFNDSFLLGGGQVYAIDDAFDSARLVVLREGTKVFASVGHEDGYPLIWSNQYGKGRIVVNNLGYYERAFRGFISASYSLLEDVSVSPVLNAACIFLDDMPSPIPEGNSDYINRDYHVSVAEFYSNYWFRDIQNLSSKYKIPLTGLVIETYNNITDGKGPQQKNTPRFTYFGNLILRSGGELGYHGYNHQPLCLSNTDYHGLFNYNTWDSKNAIDDSFSELRRFCAMLFPRTDFSTYVPPSNILSTEGRSYLSSLYPVIRTISGVYLPEANNEFTFVQEFSVSDDGIVNLPRITSGSVLGNYMQLVALSELNFHVVFSHFIHPDDAMDPDRGAELGWPTLYGNLLNFMDWLETSDPSIRRLDASHMSGSIQRWSSLSIQKEWADSNRLDIHIGNYLDEAYLLLRFNNGIPSEVTGGTITRLTDTLYMLDAAQADIRLTWNR